MTDPTVQRSLGRIEGQLAAQEKTIIGVVAGMVEQDAKLDTIMRYVEQQKGGRRVVAILSTVCGTLAGFAVSWFTGRGGQH